MKRKAVIGVGIAAYPVSGAGITWLYLQWALGFRELGWDVRLVENLRADKCFDVQWKPCAFEASANRRHWLAVMHRFGFERDATLLLDGKSPDFDGLQRFASDAELVLNISGHLKLPDLATPRARRVYLDLDPAFTQIWAEVYQSDMNFAGHDCFFSVGTRLGREDCRAPTCGIDWQPSLPPVVLSRWPFEPQAEFDRFSTIAHWHGYNWCEWKGEWYKGKSDEFSRFAGLPPRVPRARFEIATEADSLAVEFEAFRTAGWQLTSAPQVCSSLERFGEFVRDSSAEFSAAKGGYVLSQCGWFSDRSVCYLASGRPVVLQETGIGSVLPTGGGFHTFRTMEEAAERCERVARDFRREQQSARDLAEEHFASAKVIGRLLARVGI